MQAIHRVAIFRALQLGDMLCAVPAMRALRALYPRARMTLIGLPWAETFQQRFSHYLDEFMAFPGHPGLPESQPEMPAVLDFFKSVQGSFDLAIQLHGSGELTNQILLLFGARYNVGFYRRNGWCPNPLSWWPYPDEGHEIWRNLRLVQYLGAKEVDERLEFPLNPQDRNEAALWKAQAGLQLQPYVCLHPGARNPVKRWAPALFARVGDALSSRGYQVVLTGSESEHSIAEQVVRAMTRPAFNGACAISIGGMAALMADAQLVVSNDTGAAHLAVALDVPSIVIFFATDARRWAPLDLNRNRVLSDPRGVSVETVLAEIDLLFRRLKPTTG